MELLCYCDDCGEVFDVEEGAEPCPFCDSENVHILDGDELES